MTVLECAYFNYEYGGLRGAADHDYSAGRGYSFAGLVRVAGDKDRWPDILVMGEGYRYGLSGGEGMYSAAAAMRKASGRPYVPLLGSLPRDGMHGPVIFTDPRNVVIHRWFDSRSPDFAERNRNLLIASTTENPYDWFQVVAIHGDIFSGDWRLLDSQRLRRYADASLPCMICGDWNSVPSGPMWQDRELDDSERWPEGTEWQRASRVQWQHGSGQAWRPLKPDTRALDYLIGWQDGMAESRIGGIGFWSVAELANDPTPTQVAAMDGRQRRAIDSCIVNQPMKERLITGSYQVHEPADPACPDSDHKRISWAIEA